MNLCQGIILGIVEGLTEFLPISSTGHLILATKLLGLNQTDFIKSFQIAIQLGAILAVVILYFKSFFELKTLFKVSVSFIPTAILGVLFYKVIKNFLLNKYFLVLVSLFLGGLVLIFFEIIYKKNIKKFKKTQISFFDALIIGLIQAIAFIPGVSRSLATILGGLFLGIDRKKIVEFSFLLAVPTILGATVFDIANTYRKFSMLEVKSLLVGFIFAFLVAVLVVKFFIRYIEKNNFLPFGIYRIVISLIFLFVF